MNKYRNNGLDTFSAQKYIERGGKSLNMDKMNAVSNTVASHNTNAQLSFIQKITEDNNISPSEKINLSKEWEYIKAAYYDTLGMAQKLEVNNTKPEYIDFVESFEILAATIVPVLEDMNSPSTVSSDFMSNFMKYTTAASTFNTYLTLLGNDRVKFMYGVSLQCQTQYGSVLPSEDITATAMIYIYQKDPNGEGNITVPISDSMKQEYAETDPSDPQGVYYPKLYRWHINGTSHDEQYEQQFLGHDTVTISSADYIKDEITVSFDAEMVVL